MEFAEAIMTESALLLMEERLPRITELDRARAGEGAKTIGSLSLTRLLAAFTQAEWKVAPFGAHPKPLASFPIYPLLYCGYLV